MTPEIILDPGELQFCRALAAMRHDPKIAARLKSTRHLGNSTYEAHLVGFCGEYVVAKYFGILPNLYISMKGDGAAADLVINGRTVQVKTRTKAGYDYGLMSTNLSEFNTDCGVLVHQVAENTFRIQGVISKKKFKQVAVIKDYGYGKRLVAEPKHFSHIDHLMPQEPEPKEEAVKPGKKKAIKPSQPEPFGPPRPHCPLCKTNPLDLQFKIPWLYWCAMCRAWFDQALERVKGKVRK